MTMKLSAKSKGLKRYCRYADKHVYNSASIVMVCGENPKYSRHVKTDWTILQLLKIVIYNIPCM